MKKLTALLLAAAMVLSLAACGGGNTPTTTPAPATTQAPATTKAPETTTAAQPGTTAAPAETTTAPADPGVPGTTATYDGSEVTIRFYHTMGTKLVEVLDLYIQEFNKIYPNIHVETTAIGSYDDVRDQIGTEIPVGNQPNIAYCYPDHVAMYNLAGAVQTLDAFINSSSEVTRADGSKEVLGLTEEQKADFIEGYYNEGRQFGDGLMYTMPFSKSTEVLYYNKTFFEANGISVPKTWDELKEVCAKIIEIDENAVPLGYDSEANWFITMTEQYGSPYTSATGDHYLFNHETNRNFVKMFHDWYHEGYLTTQTLYGAFTSGLFTSTDTIKSYMSIGSSAGAVYQRPAKVDDKYPFEVGIASIPQVDPANPKVISQGPSVCIFKKANEQETLAAWLFVKYLTPSVDFPAEFSMASGYVPVLKSVATNPTYAEFIGKADGGDFVSALSAKVCLEQENAYYTSPAFNGSSKARDQVGALMTKCLADESADIEAFIKQAFEDAIAECISANR